VKPVVPSLPSAPLPPVAELYAETLKAKHLMTININARAELGIEGNFGFALIGENLQEGEAEFVEIDPLNRARLPNTRHEQFTGEERLRAELGAELRACHEAHKRLRKRLGCPELTHRYYFGKSHPYGN